MALLSSPSSMSACKKVPLYQITALLLHMLLHMSSAETLLSGSFSDVILYYYDVAALEITFKH